MLARAALQGQAAVGRAGTAAILGSATLSKAQQIYQPKVVAALPQVGLAVSLVLAAQEGLAGQEMLAGLVVIAQA